MLKAGLIGFGLAGQVFHAPALCSVSGIELACILERRSDRAKQKYPDVRIARTVDELLEDKDIRLCVIATPNTSHLELAKACLAAGRDVVIDKPFTNTSAEAADLIEFAKQRKRLLTVYHNRRWDGDFLAVKKLVESGVLGRLVEFESHFDRFRPQVQADAWREQEGPGGGYLFDLGPHLIDQAFVLFGFPQSVTASVLCQRDGARADDAFDLRLDYPGLSVLLRSSMLAGAPGPRFVLRGTRGSFVKYTFDPEEKALREGQAPLWCESPEFEWGTLYVVEGGSFREKKMKIEAGDQRGFYENVRDAVVNGAPLAVSAEDGARTIRAVELALQSSRESRTLPW
ncbi:MAG: Gfo/Idh/MocA family oxidoreductase [Candidatus Acidiferrales bacterium]|jgi:predicted dehydrogenase